MSLVHWSAIWTGAVSTTASSSSFTCWISACQSRLEDGQKAYNSTLSIHIPSPSLSLAIDCAAYPSHTHSSVTRPPLWKFLTWVGPQMPTAVTCPSNTYHLERSFGSWEDGERKGRWGILKASCLYGNLLHRGTKDGFPCCLLNSSVFQVSYINFTSANFN